MDAIMLAGGIPDAEDPLYEYCKGKPKSLIDIHGKPMAQYVLDSLSKSDAVEKIVVVGVDESSSLTARKELVFVPDSGDLLQNALDGINQVQLSNPSAERVLILSSDIPAVTAQIVDQRVADALGHDADIDYVVVERKTMESRFPGARRSYVRLKDVEVCGGDLNFARVDLFENKTLWSRLVNARKSPARQASLIGFGLLINLLFHRLTIHEAEIQISSRLGLHGRATISPYAEVAMDVDKPEQLHIISKDLASTPPA